MIHSNLEALEPAFFAYILENPSFFHRIEPITFKNPNIQFIYKRVRDYYLKPSKVATVPSNKLIIDLIRMDDPNKKISDEFIELLLTKDVSEYTSNGDDWFVKRMRSWSSHKNIYDKLQETAEDIRKIEPIDYESMEKLAIKVKNLFGNSTILENFDDDDYGLDFDNPDSHVQDDLANKIPTGWGSLNTLLNGGWDLKTLNIIIGPSNSGKSIWLNNITVNAADHGKNVLYVTLEMSDRKIIKRLGAIRLRIDIDHYNERSKDKKYIETKIRELKSRNASNTFDSNLFENPMGTLLVKEYPAGTATIGDIDHHIKMIQEKKGIKIDMLVVDYLTIMKPDNAQGSLFTNGKQLAEGLRAIGQKYNICCVSAMQVGKDAYDANDINLSDMSESKGIIETADTIFGIIRTPIMRKEGKYILKLLKLRDGDFVWTKTHFELNRKFLKIENDTKMPD